MVQLIVGEKGKGKTKIILEKVNGEVSKATGNIVYLDKSTKHMYELNKEVRLINIQNYMVENADEFIGFVCGIISQDHDLEAMYLDSFLKIACVEEADLEVVLKKLDAVSKQFNIDFTVSVGVDESALTPSFKEQIIVSL